MGRRDHHRHTGAVLGHDLPVAPERGRAGRSVTAGSMLLRSPVRRLRVLAPGPGLVLVVVFSPCSLPGVTRRIYASDEIQFYAFLRSLWFDADLSFDNGYPPFPRARASPTTICSGRPFSNVTTPRPATAPATSARSGAPFLLGAVLRGGGRRYQAPAGGRAGRRGRGRRLFVGRTVSAVCYAFSALYGLLALLGWSAALRRPARAARLGPVAGRCHSRRSLGRVARHTPHLLHVRGARDVARHVRVRRGAVRLALAPGSGHVERRGNSSPSAPPQP